MAHEVDPKPMVDRPIDGESPASLPGPGPARRRFLKHGVTGGSVALLVAGKPVKTLAKAYCKFSGWNSLKVSKKGKKKGKGGLTLSHAPSTCSVKVQPPSYYFKKGKKKGKTTYTAVHWPSNAFHGVTITTSTTFVGLFGIPGYGGYGSWLLLDILTKAPSTVEAYMIAVAFASTQGGFPLSQTYVYNLWQNHGNVSDQPALLTFLQQLV